jgi:hypothetical protein
LSHKVVRLRYGDMMLDAARLEEELVDLSHCDRVVRDATTVVKPDGNLLLTYAPEALAPGLCAEAFEALRHLNPASSNRGMAAGPKRKAPSAVLGFYAGDTRSPGCRMTTFTIENAGAYEATLPLMSAVSAKYRELAPAHWEAQNRFATRVSPDFVIPGTVFSSVTFNKNWRTHAHTDSNNRRPGLEAMVVLTAGDIRGGELLFPRYRTAVAVAHGGLLLGDMHELHGNAPLQGSGLRLSLVCYMREGISCCGSAAEEWARAAERRCR